MKLKTILLSLFLLVLLIGCYHSYSATEFLNVSCVDGLINISCNETIKAMVW